MSNPHTDDARMDVNRIVVSYTTTSGSSRLQHVRLDYIDPTVPQVSVHHDEHTLYAGEFLTSLGGTRDDRCIRSLRFGTSLGRCIPVGPANSRDLSFEFVAPHGHELRDVTVMADQRGENMLALRPVFAPRLRVAENYRVEWVEALATATKAAEKCPELPRDLVHACVRLLDNTANRLADVDGRGVVSPAALAAAFDCFIELLNNDVFSRRVRLGTIFKGQNAVSKRVDRLTKATEALRSLKASLTDRFEVTERQILTELIVGIDATPFMRNFAYHSISAHNCDTALAVYTHHLDVLSKHPWDYPAKLMHYFIKVGALTALQNVVQLQATKFNLTRAQVFHTWAERVPAVRLAIKHRRVEVLQWLLTDGHLVAEDGPSVGGSLVRLDDDSADRFWPIDQLLEERAGDSDMPVLEHLREVIRTARNARAFLERTRELITRSPSVPIVPADVDALVPFITHAVDLRWFFTLVEMYPSTQRSTLSIETLFARAFNHVIDKRLVLDRASALFFRKALAEATQRKYLSRNAVNDLNFDFNRAQIEGAPWVRALKLQINRAVYRLDDLAADVKTLKDTIHSLRESLGEREMIDRDRLVRKQLLVMVSVLLPLIAPTFSLLEECVSLSDPLELAVAIMTGPDAAEADVRSSLSDREGRAGLHMQESFTAALSAIDVDAQEFLDMLRDALHQDDNSLNESEDVERSETVSRIENVQTIERIQREQLAKRCIAIANVINCW